MKTQCDGAASSGKPKLVVQVWLGDRTFGDRGCAGLSPGDTHLPIVSLATICSSTFATDRQTLVRVLRVP